MKQLYWALRWSTERTRIYSLQIFQRRSAVALSVVSRRIRGHHFFISASNCAAFDLRTGGLRCDWLTVEVRLGNAQAISSGTVGCRLHLLPVQIASVLVEHVSQNVLGVLQSLDHLKICWLHSWVQWVCAPLASFVHIGDDFGLWTEHDLSVILEVHLDHLVRKTEHDGMACTHPFLHVDDVLYATGSSLNIFWHLLVWIGLLSALQIAPEVLE